MHNWTHQLRPITRQLLLGGILTTCFSLGAAAQASPDRLTELERKLEQALQQVQVLNARLAKVEGSATARTEPAALAAKVEALESEVAAISNRPPEDHGLALHGFADVGAGAGSKGRPVGGSISSVDFYLTPKFGDRVKALIEMNVEAGPDGSVGVDLERLQMGYIVSDNLTLWGGRFHTPYGYWNTAFHHGAQLQTAISRPKFLDFEDSGGILPAHTVGLWGTGTRKIGGGKMAYDLYIGNSPTIGVSDPAVAGTGTLDPGLRGAANRSATIGGNFSYAFGSGGLDGLTLGVHSLSSRVADNSAQQNITRVRMSGAWLTYLEGDWEAMGELYRFHNADLRGISHPRPSTASYFQVGRNFGVLTPYFRYEKTALDQNDSFFAQQTSGQSYHRTSLGLRYDLNPTASLKFEAGRTVETDRTTGSFTEVRSQFAVRF
jgi:hypothetical protein